MKLLESLVTCVYKTTSSVVGRKLIPSKKLELSDRGHLSNDPSCQTSNICCKSLFPGPKCGSLMHLVMMSARPARSAACENRPRRSRFLAPSYGLGIGTYAHLQSTAMRAQPSCCTRVYAVIILFLLSFDRRTYDGQLSNASPYSKG